jgi:hypothetical protein
MRGAETHDSIPTSASTTKLFALPAGWRVAVNLEHSAHVERPLTDSEQRVLAALLDYGRGAERSATCLRRAVARFRHGPRTATDIAKLCFLPVHRERVARVVKRRSHRYRRNSLKNLE